MHGQRPSTKLLSDSAVYGLSAAIAKALALLTVPYLTRTLSPEGYGIADLATSTAALLTLIAMFSGDIPAARAYGISDDQGHRLRVLSSYVWVTIGITTVVAIVLIPVAHLIAGQGWGEPGQTDLAIIALLLVPVSGAQAALAQTQRIQSRPRRFAVLAFVDLLAQLGLAVGLVAAGFGPMGVILGFVLGSLFGLAVAAFAAREILLTTPDLRLARQTVAAGVRFLPHVTMFVLADWILRSVVANSIGAAAVAQLGLAIRVASILTLVSAAFAMAFGPVGLARTRGGETSKLFGRLLLGYGSASVVAALGVATFGPELVRLVAGPGYDRAALILPGFALAYAIAGTEYILVIAAGISNRASRVAVAATVGAGVQVALSALLVPSLGILAIGPSAIAGRGVSFGLLLAAVGGTLSFQLSRVVIIGLTSVVAAVGLELMIAQGSAWFLARAAVAAIMIPLAWVLIQPLLAARRPETA